MNRIKLLIIFSAAVILVLFSFLTVKIYLISKNLEETKKNFISGMEKEDNRINRINTGLVQFNSDFNEVRRKLYLPQRNYISDDSEIPSDNSTVEKETENEDLKFFLAADRLISFSKNLDIKKKAASLVSDSGTIKLLGRFNLILKEVNGDYFFLRDGREYYKLHVSNSMEPVITITSRGASKEFNLGGKKEDFIQLLKNFIGNTIPDLEKYFKLKEENLELYNSLVKDKKILEVIKKYNLIEKKGISDGGLLKNEILTMDSISLLTYKFDPETLIFSLNSVKYEDFTAFKASLIKNLLSVDKRTAVERKIDSAKEKIKALSKDKVFAKYLDQRNLVLTQNERDDNDYFYYDFLDKNGVKQGALGVQKHIGEIYLFDSEDVVIASLKTLALNASTAVNTNRFKIPENIPALTSMIDDNNSINLLLIGSHEKNADTIILVNLNEDRNKISLISIPRDLYYRNRKINYYYRTFGGPQFTEIISGITGLKISGYIGVDMYAFIDIINILGGIDVELSADLIDPTYKIRDNGVWTTLYYSKGMHHFNGIEALRIARSRHTSSDFGRSDRQQLILQGVMDKLNGLGISNVNKIYSIFKTVNDYMDTNLSPMEMIAIYLKYKNADLEKKDGLSSFNVLYSTYSNIFALKDKSRQNEPGFIRGAWILLPRNNDWNVIKWYINKTLQE